MNEVCLKLADINITCNSTFSELYYDQISIPYQEEIKINLINDEKTILPLSSLQKYKFLTINGIGTCHILIDDQNYLQDTRCNFYLANLHFPQNENKMINLYFNTLYMSKTKIINSNNYEINAAGSIVFMDLESAYEFDNIIAENMRIVIKNQIETNKTTHLTNLDRASKPEIGIGMKSFNGEIKFSGRHIYIAKHLVIDSIISTKVSLTITDSNTSFLVEKDFNQNMKQIIDVLSIHSNMTLHGFSGEVILQRINYSVADTRAVLEGNVLYGNLCFLEDKNNSFVTIMEPSIQIMNLAQISNVCFEPKHKGTTINVKDYSISSSVFCSNDTVFNVESLHVQGMQCHELHGTWNVTSSVIETATVIINKLENKRMMINSSLLHGTPVTLVEESYIDHLTYCYISNTLPPAFEKLTNTKFVLIKGRRRNFIDKIDFPLTPHAIFKAFRKTLNETYDELSIRFDHNPLIVEAVVCIEKDLLICPSYTFYRSQDNMTDFSEFNTPATTNITFFIHSDITVPLDISLLKMNSLRIDGCNHSILLKTKGKIPFYIVLMNGEYTFVDECINTNVLNFHNTVTLKNSISLNTKSMKITTEQFKNVKSINVSILIIEVYQPNITIKLSNKLTTISSNNTKVADIDSEKVKNLFISVLNSDEITIACEPNYRSNSLMTINDSTSSTKPLNLYIDNSFTNIANSSLPNLFLFRETKIFANAGVIPFNIVANRAAQLFINTTKNSVVLSQMIILTSVNIDFRSSPRVIINILSVHMLSNSDLTTTQEDCTIYIQNISLKRDSTVSISNSYILGTVDIMDNTVLELSGSDLSFAHIRMHPDSLITVFGSIYTLVPPKEITLEGNHSIPATIVKFESDILIDDWIDRVKIEQTNQTNTLELMYLANSINATYADQVTEANKARKQLNVWIYILICLAAFIVICVVFIVCFICKEKKEITMTDDIRETVLTQKLIN